MDLFVKQAQVLDVESGQTTPLTQGEWKHTPVAWSPAGNELLYLANFDPDSIFTSADIHIVDMNGSSRLILSKEWGIIKTPNG